MTTKWIGIGALACGIVAACSSAVPETAMVHGAAQLRSDSMCADSQLQLVLDDSTQPRGAIAGTPFSVGYTASNPTSTACYTTAMAFAVHKGSGVAVVAPYQDPNDTFLLAAYSGPIPVTGYYEAPDTGNGVVGMSIGGSGASASIPVEVLSSLAVTGFSATSCDRYFSGGKWRITWTLSWSVNASPGTIAWQVLESSTNDTTAGTVIASGRFGTTATSPEYTEIFGPEYYYFWVEYPGTTAWYPLDSNPLLVTTCSL